jgi:hypothetical protein
MIGGRQKSVSITVRKEACYTFGMLIWRSKKRIPKLMLLIGCCGIAISSSVFIGQSVWRKEKTRHAQIYYSDTNIWTVTEERAQNFCGKVFYSKDILLGEKYVVKRISEIAKFKQDRPPCAILNTLRNESSLTVRSRSCGKSFPGALCLGFEGGEYIIYLDSGKIYTPTFDSLKFFGTL